MRAIVLHPHRSMNTCSGELPARTSALHAVEVLCVSLACVVTSAVAHSYQISQAHHLDPSTPAGNSLPLGVPQVLLRVASHQGREPQVKVGPLVDKSKAPAHGQRSWSPT